MKCPACKTINLTMSERSGIEIDYCPECRGVWLDRGELDKIIEKANGGATIEQPNFRAPTPQNYGHQEYYKHKRKKSFLEEIFD